MQPHTMTEIRHLTLEALRLRLTKAFSRRYGLYTAESTTLTQEVNYLVDAFIYEVEVKLAASNLWTEIEKVSRVPLSWWDAFKLRWFPSWLLARYPADWKEIETELYHIHVCPHLNANPQEDHLRFLLPREDKREQDAIALLHHIYGRCLWLPTTKPQEVLDHLRRLLEGSGLLTLPDTPKDVDGGSLL